MDGRLRQHEGLMQLGAGRPAHIALFCGGRGSASISAELVRRPDIKTSIIINGFDDGLSTGALRRMVPGLLGPSDFRKAFARLLDPAVPSQRALRVLLEHRFAGVDGALPLAGLRRFSLIGDASTLTPELADALNAVDPSLGAVIREYMSLYFDYTDRLRSSTGYADFALGNIIFTGIYLKVGDFNTSVRTLAELCAVPADVLNVSAGDCRWLAALKADGCLLPGESEIVGPQSASPIVGLYLLEQPVSAPEWRRVAQGSWQQKHDWLSERERPAAMCSGAAAAISRSDMIIYGPGTQHSSLFPSYRVAAEALKSSRASIKALVINLDPDHDILGLSALDIVKRALHYLEDTANESRVITHVVHDPSATLADDGAVARLVQSCARYGIEVLPGHYRGAARPDTHCGRAVVDTLLPLCWQSVERRIEPRRATGALVPVAYRLAPLSEGRSRVAGERRPPMP